MKFEIASKSTEIQASWYDAKMYCFALTHNEKTGWRLPTKSELSEIYNSDNDFDGWYWTSIEIDDKRVWVRSFLTDMFHKVDKLDDRIRIRLVRDLPCISEKAIECRLK